MSLFPTQQVIANGPACHTGRGCCWPRQSFWRAHCCSAGSGVLHARLTIQTYPGARHAQHCDAPANQMTCRLLPGPCLTGQPRSGRTIRHAIWVCSPPGWTMAARKSRHLQRPCTLPVAKRGRAVSCGKCSTGGCRIMPTRGKRQGHSPPCRHSIRTGSTSRLLRPPGSRVIQPDGFLCLAN